MSKRNSNVSLSNFTSFSHLWHWPVKLFSFYYKFNLYETLLAQKLSDNNSIWFEVRIRRINEYRYKIFMLVLYLLSQPHFVTCLNVTYNVSIFKRRIFYISQRHIEWPKLLSGRRAVYDELGSLNEVLTDLKNIASKYSDLNDCPLNHFKLSVIEQFFDDLIGCRSDIRIAKRIISDTLKAIKNTSAY